MLNFILPWQDKENMNNHKYVCNTVADFIIALNYCDGRLLTSCL